MEEVKLILFAWVRYLKITTYLFISTGILYEREHTVTFRQTKLYQNREQLDQYAIHITQATILKRFCKFESNAQMNRLPATYQQQSRAKIFGLNIFY